MDSLEAYRAMFTDAEQKVLKCNLWQKFQQLVIPRDQTDTRELLRCVNHWFREGMEHEGIGKLQFKTAGEFTNADPTKVIVPLKYPDNPTVFLATAHEYASLGLLLETLYKYKRPIIFCQSDRVCRRLMPLVRTWIDASSMPVEVHLSHLHAEDHAATLERHRTGPGVQITFDGGFLSSTEADTLENLDLACCDVVLDIEYVCDSELVSYVRKRWMPASRHVPFRVDGCDILHVVYESGPLFFVKNEDGLFQRKG